MFHSSVFTMASNVQPKEDKPMHPAGLHMTRGSLQDILDRNDINVSTALPPVSQDTTNPFINPNHTLTDILGRNLGPLSSLKITDADLIIHNLKGKLNATIKKKLCKYHTSAKDGPMPKANRSPSASKKKRKLPLGKNTTTSSIKKGLWKTFSVIWKRNTPIKNKTT